MPDTPMFDPKRVQFEFYPFTAREALLEIRRIAETGPDSIETEMIAAVTKVGLDTLGMENFETTDRLADRLAEAHDLLGKMRQPEHEALLGEIDAVLALPPDLEAMLDRRLGRDRERPESAEQVRLQLADILVEGRSQVLQKMAVTRDLEGRKILGEMDQLIQAMFERFAPERWAEELAKAEAAESAAPSPDEDGERIEVMAKVLAGLADRGAQPWIDLPDAVRDGFRHKARAVWAADQDLIKRRIEAAE